MNLLYIPAYHHITHAANLRSCIGTANNLLVRQQPTQELADITLLCLQQLQRGVAVSGIIVSDPEVLNKYLAKAYGITATKKDEATLANYAGCMFTHLAKLPNGKSYTIPVVVIDNPEFVAYDPAKKFITERYISKLYSPKWFTAPRLSWKPVYVEEDYESFEKFVSLCNSPQALVCGVDIETALDEYPLSIMQHTVINGVKLAGLGYQGYPRTKTNAKSKTKYVYLIPKITMVGYCCIYRTASGKLRSETIVIPISSMAGVEAIRVLNLSKVAKVMHNGRYDANYFLRYNAPLRNYAFDTYMLMHCMCPELRRTLAHTSAYFLRNHMFWKDESSSAPMEYNAKDCHATAWSLVAMLLEVEDYVSTNYVSVFKQVFPCITCEIEGFKQDEQEAARLWHHYQAEIAKESEWWSKVVVPHFNVGSSVQVNQLFNGILGAGIKDTGVKTLKGIQHIHPLWRMLVDKLISTRKNRKADSTYMNIITFSGRILFGVDPSGTDTGRYASKESNFWCGSQIQNQPPYVKSMYVPDEGWELNAIDNSQSESRTTAYITGEEKLIDAVENSKDFHVRNASLFFGIPEEELWELKESNPALYKTIRNEIGKRVNHGANYNMGEFVLIETMTPTNIIKAKATLKLPVHYTFKMVAKYLLDCFDNAYPKVRSKQVGGYHYAVIEEVRITGKLVNPDGWVRKTFLRPWESKQDLNACVAHKPQSWSVKIINRAFFDAWYQYQIVENKCRMKAQVHDEIIYQTKPENTEYVTSGISTLMARPNKFTANTSGLGVDGEMVIPNDPKTKGKTWKDLKD